MPLPPLPPPGDPVPGLLAGLGLQAETLRAVATRAGLLAGALDWRSAGAQRFDDRVAALAGALRSAADQLESLPQPFARPASDPNGPAVAPAAGGP